MSKQRLLKNSKKILLVLASLLLVTTIICGVLINTNQVVEEEPVMTVKVLDISSFDEENGEEKIEEGESNTDTGNEADTGKNVAEKTIVERKTVAGKDGIKRAAKYENNSKTYINSSNTVTLQLDGTDDTKIKTSSLTANNIVVKVGETAVTPTTKNLNTATQITNGYRYTLTLSGIPGNGDLSIEIAENTLTDEALNKNGKTTFDSSKIVIDNDAPSVNFGTNGSTTYAKSHSTTVTVTDNKASDSGLVANSLKYVWTQSTTAPANESSFTGTFTNGGTVSSPTATNPSGDNWYLWILAKDNVGNVSKIKSNAFYLDNTPPTLTLSKETYQEGIDGWTIPEGASIDGDGVLTISQAGQVKSKRYKTDGEKWYPEYEALTTTALADSTKGGIHNSLEYFDNSFNNVGNNGVAFKAELNSWTSSLVDSRYVNQSLGYGGDIKYISLYINTGTKFSQQPVKIRNFKMHGQLYSSFYDITVAPEDNSNSIAKIKFAKGSQNVAYFASAGENVDLNTKTFQVTENATYTVYVEDSSGNGAVQTIVVDKIDTTKPTITADNITYGQDLTIKFKDNLSGVTGWQVTDSNTAPTSGWEEIPAAEPNVEVTKTKSGLTAGKKYIWVMDAAGNKESKEITVSQKSITEFTIDKTETKYTGSAITVTPTVKSETTTLTSGTDYDITYTNNTNIGTVTVTATGKGNYTGTLTKTFTIYYEVTYQKENNNVSAISKTTEKNTTGKATLPKITPATGYHVLGWYNGTTKVGDSEQTNVTISNNVTLTAKVETNTYTVTLDPNGGSGGTTTIYEKYNTGWYSDVNCTNKITSITAPTRTGYTFAGYILEGNTTIWIDNTGNIKLSANATSNNNVTLKAQWTANTYTINYYQGNGTSTAGTTLLGTSTVTYDQEITLTTYANLGGVFPYSSAHNTANGTGNYGWTFAGWSTTQTGTSRNYTNGQKFTYTITGDLNLYAVGSKNFYFNGGIKPTARISTQTEYWNPYSTSTNYMTAINIPNKVDIDGWTFLGYKGGSSTANATVTFSASQAGTSVTPAYNVGSTGTHRSVYSRTVTVQYNANGGSGTTANTTATQYYNSGYASGSTNKGDDTSTPSFELATNSFTRTGYTFSKWADGSVSGTQYAAGATYTGFKPEVDDTATTKTMYAIWTPNNYTITLNPNGGTYNSKTTNSTVTAAYDSDVNLGYPTRTGYTFKQWKTSDGKIFDKNLLNGALAPTTVGTSSSNANGTWRSASGGTGTRTVIDVTDPPVEGITKGFSITRSSGAVDVSQDSVPVTTGNTYTMSVWAKGTGSLNLQAGNSTYDNKLYTLDNVTSWTKYSWTFVAGTNGTSNGEKTNIYFGNLGGTSTIQICGMKLEEGTGFTSLLWSKVPSTTTAPTLVAEWADETAPVISSATAGTDWDLSNYVNFTATDAGSKITGYNISTNGTTAPTTWIPVVDVVDAATETKYEYNAAWARVFHHNVHWGAELFSNANSYAEAKSSNTLDKYSVLENIADYKNASNWEFLLQYPQLDGTKYNRWTQTGNPVTTNNAAVGYSISNTGGHADWTGSSWAGLALSNKGDTFIDGSPGDDTWFYAIGASSAWKTSIPGPNSTPISNVNLWARIDNLTTTTKDSVTKRVGDIRTNGTYYVWVKDVAGNTTSKAVTINRVDPTAPATATITSTNNVATSQTATLTMGDAQSGVQRYYWGTTNPDSAGVTWVKYDTAAASKTETKTVNAAGIYYLGVQDAVGNKTVASKAFYKTTLTVGKGSVSPASVITMDGNSFNLPTPSAVTGYTFDGWYDAETGGTKIGAAGASYKPTASKTLYGHWTANTNTAYKVNHYVHDLGADTYTLNSTDNLTGTTDSTLTLANLKKTIEGATYVDGYLTGNTTKPTSGTVTETTVAADGSRVINLYYRRNYLYVQYDVNQGALSDSHGSDYSQSGTLIAVNSETKYWKGVYGSKVGGVTTSTYDIDTTGLHNYNNSSYINIVRSGYKAQVEAEWNLAADGTGTAYSQTVSTYNANDMATAAGQNLANGDVTVTLYVNWVAENYGEYNTSNKITKYYATLADATSGATSGNTIKPLKTQSDASSPTIAAAKTLALDLNTYTVTMTNTITNDGTLTIGGTSGTLTNATNHTITNTGTLTKTGASTISNTLSSKYVISNSGSKNIAITAGNVTATGATAIYSTSTGTITVGTSGDTSTTSPAITGKIYGNSNSCGEVIVYSGKITGTSEDCIRSRGNITINGGDLSSTATYGVYSYSNASAKLKITGGTITCSDSYAVTTSNSVGATIEIEGGTITRTKTSGSGAAVNNFLGNTTIKGGTIENKSGPGVYARSGNVTLGENSGTPNTENPSIIGTTYGVQVTEGELNFYDGIVKGSSSNGALSKEPTNTPNGYGVARTTANSQETALLQREYTVSFNANGGSGGQTANVTAVYTAAMPSISTTAPTRTGYTFAGWYDTADETGGTQYYTAAGASARAYNKTSNTTLYARWVKNKVTITLKKDGENSTALNGYKLYISTSNSTNSKTWSATTEANATLVINGEMDASKTYYVWMGKDSNHKTADADMAYTGASFTGAKEATATVNFYTVTASLSNSTMTFNGTSLSNGGTVVALGTTSAIHAIAATASSGYTFSSWSSNNTTNMGITAATTASTTLSKLAGVATLTATSNYTAKPTITRTDYNTFSVSATAGSQYFISQTQTTAPAASTSGWATTTTKEVSTTAKETWYVWVKNAAGGVSPNCTTITNYLIKLMPGTGTTLTAKLDTTSGTNVTSGMYVLDKTPVYPTGALKTGYNTLKVIESINEYSGNNPMVSSEIISNSSKRIIEADTDYSTSATANTYNVIFNKNATDATGTMANQSIKYDEAKDLTANSFSRSGYTFTGWSTNAGDKVLVYDNAEYTGSKPSETTGYSDFKSYSVEGPFSSGQVYQLDVDVKGSGTMYNYFYGASNYLRVASWTSPTTGSSGTNTNGRNAIPLTSTYTHYSVKFTLGSTGDGSVIKYMLFRAMPGCTASIKNVRINKVTNTTTAYSNQQSVKNLTTSGNFNLYALWVKNNYQNTNTGIYYETLSSAFTSVANNQTIKTMVNITETKEPVLASGKTGVKLDLNGKTITLDSVALTNNGTLDIYSSVNGGTITGNGRENVITYSLNYYGMDVGCTQTLQIIINNNGILTTNGTSNSNTLTITSDVTSRSQFTPDGYIIQNAGIYNNSSKTMTLNDNTIILNQVANYGICNINGATISSAEGIGLYGTSPKLVMTKGTISRINTITTQKATIEISDGNINGAQTSLWSLDSMNGITVITGEADINITGGIIGSMETENVTIGIEITNNCKANINISGGTIIGRGVCIESHNDSIINISGGSFDGYTGISGNNEDVTITGGEFDVFCDSVELDSVNSKVTIGTNEDTPNVSKTTPSFYSDFANSSVNCIKTNGTLNYYDGVIQMKSGSGGAFSKTPDNIPTGYFVYTSTSNNMETTVLMQKGDVNVDGVVNNTDLQLLQRYKNGESVTINTTAADLDNDGSITMKDVTELQRLVNN